jgi:hypothetical protein
VGTWTVLDDLERELEWEVLSVDGQDARHLQVSAGDVVAKRLRIDRARCEAQVGLSLRPENVPHRAVPQEVARLEAFDRHLHDDPRADPDRRGDQGGRCLAISADDLGVERKEDALARPVGDAVIAGLEDLLIGGDAPYGEQKHEDTEAGDQTFHGGSPWAADGMP